MNKWLYLVLFLGSVAMGLIYLKWFKGPSNSNQGATPSPTANIEPTQDAGNSLLNNVSPPGPPQQQYPTQPIPQIVQPNPQYTPPPNNYDNNIPNTYNYEPPPPPPMDPENPGEPYNPQPFEPLTPDGEFGNPPPPPPPPPPPEEDYD